MRGFTVKALGPFPSEPTGEKSHCEKRLSLKPGLFILLRKVKNLTTLPRAALFPSACRSLLLSMKDTVFMSKRISAVLKLKGPVLIRSVKFASVLGSSQLMVCSKIHFIAALKKILTATQT